MSEPITDPAPPLSWFLAPVDESGDDESGDGELADAVVVALGTDRRADPSDVLPGFDDDDRRGWWGDLDAQPLFDGWPIGTRLWLLERAKITPAEARGGATTARARAYVLESLQPFIDRRIASRVEVDAVRNAIDMIDVSATLYRGPAQVVDLRYALLWTRIQG